MPYEYSERSISALSDPEVRDRVESFESILTLGGLGLSSGKSSKLGDLLRTPC